jgi:RND family efflux transporter MFP subunit
LNELQIFKRIVAPFDGVVTRRAAEVGMLVTAGEEPLFVVEDMSRVRVQVNVPQAYSVQTIIGADATVSLPEAATAAVRAKITRITNSVDVQSRTMLAEVELDNVNLHFQPGSYAQVALQTRSNDGWTIPTNTIQMRVEGPHVAVVDERNQIQVKPVTLGRDLGTRVVAIDGIHGDERLVINPSDDLVRGLRVKVAEPHEAVREIAQR